MKREQYVCLVCGFNMIGFYPNRCPFCGAAKKHFITAEECSARYKVVATPVSQKVTRLNSHPPLGLEHAAFRIETNGCACWIDCPSSFDSSLKRAETILFTHHHFLGASNLYREHFAAKIQIHRDDSVHEICRPFTFDAPSIRALCIEASRPSTPTDIHPVSPSTFSTIFSSSVTMSSLTAMA